MVATIVAMTRATISPKSILSSKKSSAKSPACVPSSVIPVNTTPAILAPILAKLLVIQAVLQVVRVLVIHRARLLHLLALVLPLHAHRHLRHLALVLHLLAHRVTHHLPHLASHAEVKYISFLKNIFKNVK